MQVPLEGRRINTVYGSEQQPPELGQPADNVLQFTWKGLKSAYTGLLDIIFTARVTLHMRGLLFESRVENRSPYTVESVEYPCLGAVERLEGAQPFYRMNGAYCRLMKTELAPHFANQMGYWAWITLLSWPGALKAPLCWWAMRNRACMSATMIPPARSWCSSVLS